MGYSNGTTLSIDEIKSFVGDCNALGVCAECGENVDYNDFHNMECVNEYSISGLCMKCQLRFFGR